MRDFDEMDDANQRAGARRAAAVLTQANCGCYDEVLAT
jgi:hypothetical protein